MLIEPNTYIRLIKNCPLDNKYEHTILFNSAEEQTAYFKGLPGKNFTKQSYQRHSKGVLSVQATMGEIYDCNYMMFNNESFENKMFYAFVTRVEYVNNVTCRVYYELDVMQTWFLDCQLKECFVEREHSLTDNVGDNVIHEDIYYGPYVYGASYQPVCDNLTMTELCLVIMYNPAIIDLVDLATDDDFYFFKKNYFGGAYQGIGFIGIPAYKETLAKLETVFATTDFLSGGGFIGAFMMPTMFFPKENTYNEYGNTYYFTVPRNTDFDGYTPNNNKLFTYPYTCANLTANRSSGNDYGFEFFKDSELSELDGSKALFGVVGSFCANPGVMGFACHYKGIDEFLEGAISIPSYPISTWGSDGVTEWINNNLFKSLATIGVNSALGGVSPVESTGGNIQPLLGAGKHANLSGQFTNAINDMSYAFNSAVTTPDGIVASIGAARSEFDPGAVHGSVDGDVFISTINGRRIVARVKRIIGPYAKRIDQFFDRYGYATMSVKCPNISSRPLWNYVKTKGCMLTGSAPAEVISTIASLFDRGITFWKKGAEIGVYDGKGNRPT